MISGEASSYGRPNNPTLFDTVNAATYTAHSIENVHEREHMEIMAGTLLQSWR
jgi:hypothetical protein